MKKIILLGMLVVLIFTSLISCTTVDYIGDKEFVPEEVVKGNLPGRIWELMEFKVQKLTQIDTGNDADALFNVENISEMENIFIYEYENVLILTSSKYGKLMSMEYTHREMDVIISNIKISRKAEKLFSISQNSMVGSDSFEVFYIAGTTKLWIQGYLDGKRITFEAYLCR